MLNKIETIFKAKNQVLILVFLSAIAITILAFIFDLRNTLTYPGTDLRNRVVGARLMLEGIDPYFFKWHTGLPETFYDPLDIPSEALSKLSVPPTVLVLHSTIAKLPYLQQKILWLIVQWGAFIGTVSIFIKGSDSKIKASAVAIVGFFLPIAFFGVFISTQVKYI
ncbi:hypothetical protein IQ255_05055 [Pleurocapsales cyanobacterium LEGE 10410]|nr:hypothetical protein [Pleurocapsales cyanobacterium LEGE 10410]